MAAVTRPVFLVGLIPQGQRACGTCTINASRWIFGVVIVVFRLGKTDTLLSSNARLALCSNLHIAIRKGYAACQHGARTRSTHTNTKHKVESRVPNARASMCMTYCLGNSP